MCDMGGCLNESVVLVDLASSASITVARSDVSAPSDAPDPAVRLDQDDVPVPVADQRLGFCVVHAAAYGLNGSIVKGVILADQTGRPFPEGHVLNPTFTWQVDNG